MFTLNLTTLTITVSKGNLILSLTTTQSCLNLKQFYVYVTLAIGYLMSSLTVAFTKKRMLFAKP